MTERVNPPIYEYDGESVPEINASFVSIKSRGNEALSKVAEHIPANSSVSINLRDSGELPNYRSRVALSVTGNAGGTADLSAFVSELKKNNVYVSACFYSSLAEVSAHDARLAVIDYEAALIAEAFAAGVDDVLVLGLQMDGDGVAYASRLFYKARERVDNARLGVAVSSLEFKSNAGAGATASCSEFADFCAVAMRDSVDSPAPVAKSMIYYFEKYPLRVLIGSSSDDESALAELGIYNIQRTEEKETVG